MIAKTMASFCRIPAIAALLLISLPGQKAHGQSLPPIKDFQVFQTDKQTGVLKSLLRGDTGVKLADKLWKLTGVRAETYSYSGTTRQTNFVVVAADCLWNEASQVATSPSTVEAKTADGKLVISGVGFEWRHTNATLVLSNRTRTTIAGELLGLSTNGPARKLEISSDRFEFLRDAGLAIYRGNVSGSDGLMSLRCQELILTNSASETKIKIDSALARGAVSFEETGGMSATADQAVYWGEAGKEVILLQGQAKWRTKDYEGGGESLRYSRGDGAFEAHENAWLRMNPAKPAASVKPSDSLFGIGNEPVDLKAREIRGRLVAGSAPEEVEAQGDVVIAQGPSRAAGQKAKLTGPPGREQVELQGDATWKTDRMEGRGQNLVWVRESNSFITDGNAWMKVLPGRAGPGERALEISAARYVFAGDRLTYTGGVRVSDPEWRLQSREVVVKLAGNQIQLIEAHGDVNIEQVPTPAAKSTTIWKLKSADATARFAHDGKSIQNIDAWGNVFIEQTAGREAAAASSGWELASETVAMNLSSAGNRIQRVKAQKGVRVEQKTRHAASGAPPWKLTSEDLTVSFAESGEKIQTLEARERVEVEQIGLMKNQKDLPWKLNSDGVKVRLASNGDQIETIEARERVYVRQVAPAEKPKPGGLWSLRCGHLNLKLGPEGKQIDTIIARENVEVVQDPSGVELGWSMKSQQATVQLAADGNQITALDAEQNVRLQQGDSYATGQKLRFTGESEKAELTGKPVAIFVPPEKDRKESGPQRMGIFYADVIIWNRKDAQVKASGANTWITEADSEGNPVLPKQ